MKKKIFVIVGTRPNFIKAFPVYEALKNNTIFDIKLIHTGQHYDNQMNDIFFEQFKFQKPDMQLTLKKTTKAGDFDNILYNNNQNLIENRQKLIQDLINYDKELGQLGEIRDELKKIFANEKPDLVLVFGDVTSTLSASIAAKSLNIKIGHVESGLRSNDLAMPEEVNRILTDYITDYFFITEESAINNLREEVKTENIFLVGNTMIDTQKKYLNIVKSRNYHNLIGLKEKQYILITLHRPSNVDNLEKLKEIFDDIEVKSKEDKIVFCMHHRTKTNLNKINYLSKILDNTNIILTDPLGYLDFSSLLYYCKYIITDSGGLQEEACSLNKSCFTLRDNTERPITLIENGGTNQLIKSIKEINFKEYKADILLWDGNSSKRINEILSKIFPNNNV